MAKQLTLNIDMDGVIYDMVGPLVAIARYKQAQELFDFDEAAISTNVDDWDIAAAWGMRSKTQFWKFFYWAVEEGLFFNGRPIDGSIDAIGNFVAAGHRVRIVTAKRFNERLVTRKAQKDCLDWLNIYAAGWVNKVEIAFTSNKQGYEADVIVDDKPSLAWVQTGEHTPGVAKANVLFDHTWNQGVDAMPVGMFPCIPHLYRAENWEQVEYLVGRLSQGGTYTYR